MPGHFAVKVRKLTIFCNFNSKPADGEPGAQESEKRPGFLENLERVLTMDQEQTRVTDLQDYEADLPFEEPVPERVVEEPQPEVMKRPGILDEYERLMDRSKDLDPDLMMAEGGVISDALEVIDLDDVPGTDYFEIVRDFDAGTAVVYSAIINRLDY
jgi:hypothetical protein